MPTILHMRQGQRAFFRLVDRTRVCAFLARRQYGKTTTFAKIALKKMMKQRDHTVIFGSAKLNLSREIVRTEARVLQLAIREATNNPHLLQVYDSTSARQPDQLTPDDFAELYETQRLEFRLYHDRTSYSRTKIVALHPDTVGETGDLMCDELRAIRNWQDVWEAVKPIISSNPQFRCTLSTTVPRDDAHYAYTQLLPPVGLDFTPNPHGNIYKSQGGITVCRVDAWDAYLDNVPLYDDDTGHPLTPDQSRQRDNDKDAWDRNYGLRFIAGGTSACGLAQLDTAQRRGLQTCRFHLIETDAQLHAAIQDLPARLGPGKLGIGLDLATTTKHTSNPTAIAIIQQNGLHYTLPLILAWKTNDPALATERIRLIIQAANARPHGGRARALHVDATNERYFATSLRENLRHLLPVRLIIGSETRKQPGREPINTKQLTGNRLIAELDDNHLTIPPQPYIRDDWRLIKKDRGQLICEPDHQGRHGDTFDAAKLALDAIAEHGPIQADPAPISTLPNGFSPTFNPTATF